MYIRAGFFKNLTAKIKHSHKQPFSFKKKNLQRSQHTNFLFPFPLSFQEGFFCLWLLVFFSVKRLQFIQQDNALAFTVTYTLIFVNVSTSSNIQVSLF